MEVVDEAAAVVFQQGLDALRVFGGDNEADVMAFIDAVDNLRVRVGRGVGVFLPRQGNDNSSILLLVV